MEVNITLVIVSIGAIWGVTWVWRAFNWVFLRPRKLERLLRKQDLRGNSYRLLFGDMIDSIQKKNEARSKPMEFSNDILPYIEPFLHQSIQNHGENSFIWFGPIPVLTVTQPELIKEVLSKVNDFPKPHFSLVEMLVPGIATLNGEKWAKHRKLINPAFHVEKLKLMMPALHVSCNEMASKWEDMVSKTGSVELDVWPYIVNFTSDVISRAAFSSSYVEGRKAFELIEEQTQTIFNSMKQGFIPGWRYVPTKANRRFSKVQKEIQNLLKGIVDKRRIEMEAGEAMKEDILGTLMELNMREMQQHGNKDILGTLMELNMREMQQHGNKEIQLGLTLDEIINECKVFYFAGQETTSVLLAYTMIMLGKHTDWQAKAREEVMEAFGAGAPDFDGLNQLKIVTMILYEVLRLYPPLPSTWRKVHGDTKLGKWSLPDGIYLNMPIICSHNDPQYWGNDATEFKPARFSEGISKATKGNFVFFPFGLGPRVCMGQNLALIEAKIALTRILQRFSFELSPSYAHSPYQLITIRPQFGAHVILHQL